MRPSDQVLAASVRWLGLLRRSSLGQAWSLIGSDPRYTDLSRTQYHAGLEWLLERGLAVERSGRVTPGPRARNIPPDDAGFEVMAEALELDQPPWLIDADEFVRTPGDLPQDAEGLAEALGLSPERSLLAIRRAQRKVDLKMRERVGALGELALMEAIERQWPGSPIHVSALDDSAGYDIAVNLPGGATHLEVKTTNRRGRMVIYLSRHEYETGWLDPAWRLIVVGLDHDDHLGAVATVRTEVLRVRVPADVDPKARWESTRFTLDGEDLEPGLRPAGSGEVLLAPSPAAFAWMPSGSHAQGSMDHGPLGL